MAAPSFLMRRGEAPSIIIQLLRHHYFASSLRPHSDGLSRSLIFRPRRSEILFSDGAGKTGNFHGDGDDSHEKRRGNPPPRGQREQNERTSFPLNFVPSLFVAPSLSHSLSVETHMCFQSDSDKVSFAASPLPPLLLLRFCRPADSISFDMSLPSNEEGKRLLSAEAISLGGRTDAGATPGPSEMRCPSHHRRSPHPLRPLFVPLARRA